MFEQDCPIATAFSDAELCEATLSGLHDMQDSSTSGFIIPLSDRYNEKRIFKHNEKLSKFNYIVH